ncbi:lipoprotein heptaprenylglyceryl N-acetyltransferase LhaT [Bacillus sp. C1]
MAYLYALLRQRSVLLFLLIINILGTIYGFMWYGDQLMETSLIFWPFVPDSPIASFFFVFVLLAFLLNKNWGLLEALAIVSLMKYGIWAVVVNGIMFMVQGDLGFIGYMLVFSHFAMVVQGLLYAPFYRIKKWHFIVAGIWTLHNDVIDYLFWQMPRYGIMHLFVEQIGYFTFWLSIVVLAITYYYCLRRNRKQFLL